MRSGKLLVMAFERLMSRSLLLTVTLLGLVAVKAGSGWQLENVLGTPIVQAQTEGDPGESGEKPAEGDLAGEGSATANSIDSGEQLTEEGFDLGGGSIFSRALDGGFVVFTCLLILVTLSVLTWAVVVAKFFYLRKIGKVGATFTKSFWDSRSLNELNSRLDDHDYSPNREVFRNGYAELVRGSQLKEQAASPEMAIHAAMDNLHRALGKAKMTEKRRMERYLPLLAISASASPFIGLFGTVWGIMGAFEGIARTGSASLAAVAPGISEALIATAFGLAAAIPAVVGYNMFSSRIRHLLGQLDGFTADFLNIVERYLVIDKTKSASGGGSAGSGLGTSSSNTAGPNTAGPNTAGPNASGVGGNPMLQST